MNAAECFNDPIGFAAGDSNLYRYVGNSPTNFIDPSGLTGISPVLPTGSLVSRLKAIATSCPAKREAERIGKAIGNTFNHNTKIVFPRFHDDRVKGYYCYEWVYGFNDAFGLESSGTYFKAQYGGVSTADGLVHAWLKITSLETNQVVYVDDGFAGGFVHNSPPSPGATYTGIWLPTDNPRADLSLPVPYRADGSPTR